MIRLTDKVSLKDMSVNKEKIAHLDAVSRKARAVMEREGLDALVVTVGDAANLLI